MNTPPPDPCIITMLRSPARLEPHTCNEAANEIERLRAERDRARRLVCELQCDPPERFIGLPHEVAQMYDWDCYGVTNGQHLRTSVAESSQEEP